MKRIIVPRIVGSMLVIAALMVPQALKAQGVTYNANVGAETKDQSVQADGFFPNELWILEGDSIKWTFVPKNELHTVTLLTPGQVRPPAPPPVGPPPPPHGPSYAFPTSCGPYAGTATYNGSACVSSFPVSSSPTPTTFTVTFPKGSAGNYKFVCLVHTDMNGTVHVLVNNAANAALLHSKDFYEDQARDEAADVLNDGDNQREEVHDSPENQVIAGTGEIVATGGGTQYRAVVRFLEGTIRIHVGESVEWTNLDPTEPHTVTFGTEPTGPVPFTPTSLVGVSTVACNPPSLVTNCTDAAGTLIGTVNATSDFLNSGFIQAQSPDRTAPAPGSNQLPPGTTRIRITFPKPGTFQYHCALHDVDGMVGTVIVEK